MTALNAGGLAVRPAQAAATIRRCIVWQFTAVSIENCLQTAGLKKYKKNKIIFRILRK